MADKQGDAAQALLHDVEELVDRKLADAQRERGVIIPGLPPVPGFKNEAHKFSLLRAAQVAMHENPRQLERTHGLELEAMRAQRDLLSEESIVAKTLNAATGASGGFLVPTEISQEVLLAVIEATILAKLGVRRVNASKGQLLFTKSSNVSAYWIDTETEAITPSDPTLTQLTLTPRALACLTGMTYLMATQSDPASEGLLRDLMARRLAQKIDQDFFLGTGALAEPRGLLNHPTVSARTVDWSDLVLGPTSIENATTKLRRMISKIREDSADYQSIGWFGEPRTAEAMELARDKQGRPLLLEATKAEVGTLLGRPFGVTAALKNATRTQMRFGAGDFSQAVLASWGVLAFATSNSHGSDFSTGVQRLRAIGLFDTNVLEPLSFVLASGFDDADLVAS